MPCKNCVYLWEQIRIIKIKKAHFNKLKFNSLVLKSGDYYRCSKPGWSTSWTAASWRWSSRAWCSWSQCRGWVARSCPFGSWGSRGTYTQGYGSETIRCFCLRRILLIRIQCRKVGRKNSINCSLEKNHQIHDFLNFNNDLLNIFRYIIEGIFIFSYKYNHVY